MSRAVLAPTVPAVSLSGVRLAVFFTRGVSLARWRQSGILERELALYRALSRHLGSLAFISYGPDGEFADDTRLSGIRVLGNSWGLSPTAYSVLAPLLHYRVLRQATVFKTNQLNGAWCAVIAKRLLGRKLVVRCGYVWSLHFAREVRGRGRYAVVRVLEWLALRSADAVVVATRADRRYLLERYGLEPDRVQVIPNFVDTDRFRPVFGTAEPGRMCFVGRLEVQKNVPALLEALRGVPGARLTIVGDGTQRPRLEAAARAAGTAVEFVGTLPHERLPEVIRRAQVFVLPSLYEGNPKALLEAMACGVAIVGSRAPGIEDVIVHGETGYLCGTSAEEIRDAVTHLLADEPLRRRLGARARQYVETECSLARIVERELQVLAAL
jgi:glycosyltransferase involved in cell wall biosynthesis